MPGAERDPISELLDEPARKLLEKAYAQPGQWVTGRLADPTTRQITWGRERGIDVTGPDNPSVAGGRGLDARSRWGRAFVRALYWNHRNWYGTGNQLSNQHGNVYRTRGPLRAEIGRHTSAGTGRHATGSRAVRVQLARGGETLERAERRAPRSHWWPNGGPRASRRELRDWE